MKIVSAKIHEVVLPLRRPFITGFGTIRNKPELIVELITEDGLHGYGESPALPDPTYTSEFIDSCLAVQEKFILPSVVGKEFSSIQEYVEQYAHVVGNQIAKCGAECAFWHLLAEKNHVSLSELLHGTQQSIEVGESIGIGERPNTVVKDAELLLKKGFRRIKLKVKPGWDEEPLQKLREKMPDVVLSIDCNATYDPTQHIDLLASFERFNLSMIEQPFPASDILGHATLQSLIKTPVCLDESIQSLDDLKTAVALKACKIVNIKPGRVGGLLESLTIEKYAIDHDLQVWCGGMLETGIGRAFNMALASRAAFTLPADMSPSSSVYMDDVVDDGLTLRSDGYIDISAKPGLGYDVNLEKLNKYTTRTVIIG